MLHLVWQCCASMINYLSPFINCKHVLPPFAHFTVTRSHNDNPHISCLSLYPQMKSSLKMWFIASLWFLSNIGETVFIRKWTVFTWKWSIVINVSNKFLINVGFIMAGWITTVSFDSIRILIVSSLITCYRNCFLNYCSVTSLNVPSQCTLGKRQMESDAGENKSLYCLKIVS